MLSDKNIVLGVTGGIACYKSCDIVSRLVKLGANVDVIMTKMHSAFLINLSIGGSIIIKHTLLKNIFNLPVFWRLL